MRIPQSLKDALDAASLENKRSLTAEVVARLEGSFAQRSGTSPRMWQCFFDLVRLQSSIETSQEMYGSYLKEAKELLQKKLDLFAGVEASSEAAEIDERLRQAENMAARIEDGHGELMAKRVALEDELGSMIEEALGAQQKKGDSF